jgi:cupin 2 domain-containing protein
MPADAVRRGRLPADAPIPDGGERFDVLFAGGRVRIEHIVSSATPDLSPYDQADDEWVVVLAGSAVLEVAGETISLAEGEWVWLPAHLVHRVVSTEPGTRWLAVHVSP